MVKVWNILHVKGRVMKQESTRSCLWILSIFVCVLLCSKGTYGEDKAGIYTDLTMASKYMAHGWNIGGDEFSFQPSVTADFLMPGLQATAWTAYPFEEDTRSNHEIDYLLKYNRTISGGELCKINLHGYFDYWVYPHLVKTENGNGDTISPTRLDGTKYHIGMSLLIPVAGANLVPSYNVYYWRPSTHDLFKAGYVHELFLQYNHEMPVFIPGADRQTIGGGASLSYHTGAMGVNSGWSHSTAHLSMGADAAGLNFSVSANQQWSYEDTVNPENEFWWTVSVAKSL